MGKYNSFGEVVRTLFRVQPSARENQIPTDPHTMLQVRYVHICSGL